MLLMSLLTALQRFRYKVSPGCATHSHTHTRLQLIHAISNFTAVGSGAAGSAAQGKSCMLEIVLCTYINNVRCMGPNWNSACFLNTFALAATARHPLNCVVYGTHFHSRSCSRSHQQHCFYKYQMQLYSFNVLETKRSHIHMHVKTCIYICIQINYNTVYINAHTCLYVCVCICLSCLTTFCKIGNRTLSFTHLYLNAVLYFPSRLHST